MMLFFDNIFSDRQKILQELYSLPPSINTIDKSIRLDNIKKSKVILKKLNGLSSDEIQNININLSVKNYQLIEDNEGDLQLIGRDDALQKTYAGRFKDFLRLSNDKEALKNALKNFGERISNLPSFNDLIDVKGINLLDIGAGDGSAAMPLFKSLNRASKATYIGVERDTNFSKHLEENFDSENYMIFIDDFREILHKLPKSAVILASHLYTTTPIPDFLNMMTKLLDQNGLIIMVHNSAISDDVKFRSFFPGLLRSMGSDTTMSIEEGIKKVGLDHLTIHYESVLKFPTVDESLWQLLKNTKQANYINHDNLTDGHKVFKNLVEFVISDRLESFNDEERNKVLDKLKQFLLENDYKFKSTCKVQVALSPSPSPEFKKEFTQLKMELDETSISRMKLR